MRKLKGAQTMNLHKDLKDKDGRVTPAGFAAGLAEAEETPYGSYFLFKSDSGIYKLTVRTYNSDRETVNRELHERKRIREIREILAPTLTKWKSLASPPKVERIKLFKIALNRSHSITTVGFYRDVAHYKTESPQYPRTAFLRKSKNEGDWVYEDTMTQV